MSADMKNREPTDSTRPLNPSMVHSPPSPLPAQPDSDNDYEGSSGDDDGFAGKPYTITLNVITRVLISILAFANSILQLESNPYEPFSVFINIVSWTVFGWNLLAAFPHIYAPLCSGGGGNNARPSRLPQIVMVVGARELVLFGGSDGGGKSRLSGKLIIDFVLAIVLVTINLLLFLLDFRLNYWWARSGNCDGIAVLSGIVMFLQLAIAIFSLFPRRTSVHFLVRPAAYGDRIQLP
ncbi:hypothetical protein F5X99DRAFT_370914 [Biscogniauxia marginata]|nr:hypothetical protein F5X99DRAFT_370914 [Biscogniauxia marginata]